MAETNVTEKPKQEVKQEVASTGAAAKEIAERNRHPLLALRDEVDRLFDEASSMLRFPWSRRSPFDLEPLLRTDMEAMAFAPPAEVDEREGEYRVTMEMPGMDETSVEVGIQDDVLSIRAEKNEEKEEKGTNRYFSERRYGLCARSFRLPANVDRDRITASMKNGVLMVTLPKTGPSQPGKRKIEIAGR
ncbi:Hsp20/alpha crystallin family protein [Azospirillum sp. sgz302134]